MKYQFLLLYSLVFLLIPGISTAQNVGLKTTAVGDSDIYHRAKQEHDRIMDPQLHAVPVERILSANAYRNKMLIPSAQASKSGATQNQALPVSSIPWSERGPTNIGGRTRGLIFDLNDKVNGYKKVFAGGVGGGLWVCKDITASPVIWTKISDFFDNLAISFIAQDPKNPDLLYASTGESFGVYTNGLGIWKSTDGGSTWSNLKSTRNFSYIASLVVDKNGSVYLAGHYYGIQKSADGGQTWKQVVGKAYPTDGADLELAANGDLYASTGDFSNGQVYLSAHAANGINQGNADKWTVITPNKRGTVGSQDTSWLRIKLACAPSDATVVYGLFEGSDTTTNITSVQRYNGLTNSWTVATVPTETFSNKQAWYALAIAVDPNDANTVLCGSLDAQKSVDGGATWNQISWWYYAATDPSYVHADHHTYVYAPGSSSRILMGTDGGISYCSALNTASPGLPVFQTKNNGYNVTQFYSVAPHPTSVNYFLAGAQDNGTQQFTQAGLNATTTASDGDGGNTFIDQLTPAIQVSSYIYNQHFLSTDNGQSFKEVFFNVHGSFINPSDYDTQGKALYSGNSTGTYFLWNNVPAGNLSDGISVPVSKFKNAQITAVTVSPRTKNRVYFGLDNGTLCVVDKANSMLENTSILLVPDPSASTTSVSCIAVDPSTENHLLVSYFNYGIPSLYETRNALAGTPVWTCVEGNLPDMPVRWVLFYPGDSTQAFIATELGVWSTTALNGSSTTWVPTNTGLANTRVDMLKYRAGDQTLAAATFGRGLFTAILPVPVKAAQTITFSKPAAQTYGGPDLSPGATSTNAATPITYTSSNPAVGTLTPAGKLHLLSAGSTVLTASQQGSASYTPATPVSQTVTVQPAPLLITAASFTKIYLDSLPGLTQTYSGFKKGDTLSSLTAITLPSTPANSSSPVGTYPITAGSATGPNYTFTTRNGTLTIVKLQPPTIKSISTATLVAGTTELITGTYFHGTTGVSFGGTPASSFKVLSATSISAVMGNGSSGLISLTTAGGTATFKGISFVPVPVLSTPGLPVIQSGGSLVLTASPASGFTYQWFNNGIAIAGATASSYTVNQNGSFSASISLNGLSQTSASMAITMKFELPATNFSIVNTSATCIGSSNGSIQLTAVQAQPYLATVTGTGYSETTRFTSSTTFTSLAAGTYQVCVTLPSQPGYQQCFSAVVAQPQELSLFTTYNKASRILSLSLTGALSYSINLNGVETLTTLNHLDLTLSRGINRLTVHTSKFCQGMLSRKFLVTDTDQVFPNPFTTVLNLNLGNTLLSVAEVRIYAMNGRLVFSSTYYNQAGVVRLGLSALNSGIYILKLTTGNDQTVFNLVKK